jgi:hypothetical protein
MNYKINKMENKIPLTVVILTYNEELNIKFALQNVIDWAANIVVLDSYSNDRTLEILNSFGVTVYFREFDNYSKQRNYAINEIAYKTDWMLFLDADEYLTEELKDEVSELFLNGKINDFDGYYLKRRFYFLGKWIKYGGYYPTWILRLFKIDKANCERDINEHITIKGNKTGKLLNDFVDSNNKDFTAWISKHNKYSTFEATQFNTETLINPNFWGKQPERTAWIRKFIWNKIMPPLLRPFIYFFYRYFFRLGFMDGKIGFIYHFMQGLVFLLIIDIKFLENKLRKGRIK